MKHQPIDWRGGFVLVVVAVVVMLIVGRWDAEISQAYRDSRNCEFRGACKP